MFVATDPLEPTPAPPARWRVLAALGAVAIGFVFSVHNPGIGAPLLFAVACGLVAVGVVTRGWVCRLSLVLALCLASSGWFAFRVHRVPTDSVARLLPQTHPAPGTLLTLEGLALDDPCVYSPPAEGMSRFSRLSTGSWFRLDTEQVITDSGTQRATGVVRVWIDGHDPPTIRAGDTVRVTGMTEPVAPPLNPGLPDGRLWAAQSGEAGSMESPGPELVERIASPGGVKAHWLRFRADLRARARRIVGEEPRTDERALVAALVLGEREHSEVSDTFTRLGLAHLMAISGFHLVVMAGAALFALRVTGDRGWVEPAALALVILVYLIIVPARPPIVRAGVMTLLLLATEASGRRYDRVTLLGWIAVAFLIFRPMDLFALGFQLSFGLTAALMWIGGSVRARVFGVRLRGVRRQPKRFAFVRDRFASLAVASLVAWALALPVVAYRTGLVSPLGIGATVLALPLIIVLLWLSYVVLIVGMAIPSIGTACAGVLDWVSSRTIALVELLDAVPGAHFYAPPISVWLCAFLVLCVLYWLSRAHTRDRIGWTLAGVAALWIGAEAWLGPRPGAALRIDMVSVGDGSCYVLRSRSDTLLWDCGSSSIVRGSRDVPRALRGLGVWRIDAAVVTHANLDHYGLLPAVAERTGLRRALAGESFLNAARDPDGAPAYLLAELRDLGVEIASVSAGGTLRIGDATLTFISPTREYEAENDNSLVALVEAPTRSGTRRVLLTGDIQEDAMTALMAPGANIGADVVELPHHGSPHETALAFIDRVSPSVVLQSTGPSRVGDPRWDTRRTGRDWRVTASGGTATVLIQRSGEIDTSSFRRDR